MVARRVFLCVPTLAVCFALFAVGTCYGGAADRPNRATQPDVAVGQMVDSIFDFDQPTNRRPTTRQRASRRRIASRHSALQGKLVNNPNQSDGTPPYALVDRYGGVLRYVEPVSHIDLSSYIGRTVGVRRDTGDTLLASQLALSGAGGSWSGGVQLANFDETIAPGEIVEGPVVMHEGPGAAYMPGGHEPIYLDDGLNFGGCTDCGSYVGCGTGCRAAPRRCCGGYFGYELTILRPVISEIETGPLKDTLGFGHRFILGYNGGAGVGARARYWFYNHGHDYVDTNEGSIGIDMDVFDLEVTLDEQLRNWDLIVSGGFRYGRAGLTDTEATTFDDTAQFAFEGFGPTVSLEATRGCARPGFYVLGNFRGSLLFGDFYNHDGTPGVKYEDEIITVLENQLGVGFNRKAGHVTLILHLAWETQFWINDSWGDDVNGFGSSLGFTGPTASAELRF